MPEELETLRHRLRRAKLRAADGPPFRPDWDAAMAWVGDLERRIRDAEGRQALVLAEADAR